MKKQNSKRILLEKLCFNCSSAACAQEIYNGYPWEISPALLEAERPKAERVNGDAKAARAYSIFRRQNISAKA